MADSEALDTFVMHGARTAAANGIPHLVAQIAALERAVAENPGLAFDLAKFIVESTCKTILNERQIGFDKNDNLPKLFKAVTTNVPMLPCTALLRFRQVIPEGTRSLGWARYLRASFAPP